jgi:TPR repeat protein
MKRWFLLCGLALLAGPARAGDQPEYAPPDAWVRPAAIPKAPASAAAADSPVQVLLDDFQVRMGPAGDDLYDERVMKILTPQGLSMSGTIGQIWDPDTESLVIHKLRIIRGDQVIDVLAGGEKFLVLRRENNLELAMLDGRLTATIQPEGLQVGDIVDVAMTVRHHDPALKGYSTDFDRLGHVGVASEVRMRASWPASKTMRWRVTDGLDAPTLTKTADGGSELSIDMTNVQTPKPPIGAPGRFQDVGSLELSQFQAWADVSRLMSPLYEKAATLKPGSPLSAEVAKIAAASNDPKVRAMAALRLVEDQTRYVFLGMNDGGLVPADAEVSWARRFGDCKGKTALLVAILRTLGIKADPALVSSANGDGIDQRLPMPAWFDHVIVRAEIGGKVYWLDGTRVGDRSLDALVVPPFHWALPVRPEGADLVKLEPEDLTQPGYEVLLKVDSSKGAAAPSPTHIELIYRGEAAVAQRSQLAALAHADFDRYVREYAGKTYPWMTVDNVTATDDEAANVAKVIIDGKSTLDWSATPDGSRFYRVPFSALGGDFSYKREPGPHQDAPFLVAYPYFERRLEQFTLPTDGDFVLIGSDVDKTAAGLAMRRRARIENGVLTVEISTHAIEQEFPAAEAEADGAAMRELGKNGVTVAYRTGFVAPNSPKAPAASQAGSPPNPAGADEDLAAAARGDAAAEYRVGLMYGQGRGVPLDPAQAIVWFRKSADQDYAAAEVALGTIYLTGAGAPADPLQAATWFGKAAAQGDVNAKADLALMYMSGIGVARDPARALQLAQSAADLQSPVGEYLLGRLYADGAGVPRDDVQAFAWMLKAAQHGHAAAQADVAWRYRIGRGVAVDPAQALVWARKSADQGHPAGLAMMGELYEVGVGGPPDYAQALVWLQKAAALDNVAAELEIARIYQQGLGVPKDPAQALDWVRKAANQGSAEAENLLGFAYETGVGVAKDYPQALVWLNKAAAKGDPRAENTLGLMYYNGEGVTKDGAQALAWFTKAADQNYARAQFNVGRMYMNGEGAPSDPVEAVGWFAKAAAQGLPEAQYALAMAYAQGRGAPMQRAASAQWMARAAEQGYGPAQAWLATTLALDPAAPRKPSLLAEWLRGRANQGDAKAEADLSWMLFYGVGVPPDPGRALSSAAEAAAKGYAPAVKLQAEYTARWPANDAMSMAALRRAADQGSAQDQRALGEIYLNGTGVAPDAALAAAYFRKAADQGDAKAQSQLGGLYLIGRGVPVDKAQAAAWFAKAAAQGDAEARRQLSALNGSAAPAP